VLLAGALARAAVRLDGRERTPRLVAIAAASTAAVFVVSPVFGAQEVDGELLALPFVMAGLTAAVRAFGSVGRASAGWWAGAGALAVAAAAVKQNMLEVFVAGSILLAVSARQGRQRAARSTLAYGAGVLACIMTLLLWAAVHGTTPVALWNAVVTFRIDALTLIAHSSPGTTRARALGVAGAFVGSGAIGLVVAALFPARRLARTRPPVVLVGVTVGVLAWEGIGVVGGGSYWLHYLVGTVPGLVLAAVVATLRGPVRRRLVSTIVLYAAVVAAGGLVVDVVASPGGPPSSNVVIDRYLVRHARPGDTGVVAFGDPALLEAAHLSSPYPELWSLPVRVNDPRLTELTRVLKGPDRPTWVVVDGASLAGWGIDAARAQQVLDAEYHVVRSVDGRRVYHLRGHRPESAGRPAVTAPRRPVG
jgi:hypothetical protein